MLEVQAYGGEEVSGVGGVEVVVADVRESQVVSQLGVEEGIL